ncbi:MAG: signal peptidase II [Anaerolineae bacterium]|nr:signal peptidase II [Anaerolineae bacterium]
MTGRQGKWLLLLPVAALVLILDQLSKSWVLRNIPLYETWVPIPALARVFVFRHVTNTGAAFGLFPNGGAILLAIAVVVIVAIVVYTRYLPTERWLVLLSLGLQLGGALGNLIDRLRFGHVVDFIDFHFWPTFNVADMSLVTGVALLALLMLTEKRERQAQETAEGQ